MRTCVVAKSRFAELAAPRKAIARAGGRDTYGNAPAKFRQLRTRLHVAPQVDKDYLLPAKLNAGVSKLLGIEEAWRVGY